jgi:hypothetical protein
MINNSFWSMRLLNNRMEKWMRKCSCDWSEVNISCISILKWKLIIHCQCLHLNIHMLNILIRLFNLFFLATQSQLVLFLNFFYSFNGNHLIFLLFKSLYLYFLGILCFFVWVPVYLNWIQIIILVLLLSWIKVSNSF